MPTPDVTMHISCGMYAFTNAMQESWAHIFKNLHRHLPLPFNRPFDLQFESPDQALNHSHLFMGHTCGYPYVTNWHKTHKTVCVPEFHVPGCNGIQYSSLFVARADCKNSELGEFKGSVAAMNTRDSNSGMNVFRYDVAGIAHGESFFRNVLVSGSHLASMNMVIQGIADIAAIDAVTYHFAVKQNLVDASKLKTTGYSRNTAGLPFIVSRKLDLERETVVSAMNTCLDSMPESQKSFMEIRRFTAVDSNDYESVKFLESESRRLGYPELR